VNRFTIAFLTEKVFWIGTSVLFPGPFLVWSA
jgi:hypothetical protein